MRRETQQRPTGGILVTTSMLGVFACAACGLRFGLGLAMELMLAETLVMFGAIWTLGRAD